MLRMELAPGGLQRLRLTLTRGDLLGCNVLPGFYLAIEALMCDDRPVYAPQ